MSVISAFLMAARVGIVGVQHFSTILAHHGQFGVQYDSICKALVEDMRTVACYSSNSSQAVDVIASAMENVRWILISPIRNPYGMLTDSLDSRVSPSNTSSMV